MLSAEEQLHIVESGVAQIIQEDALLEKFETGKPLTIKLGVDPTAPDIHIGHAVPLRKMRQFQDLGHNVVLIIGDGTAMIGDPSGKNTTRPQLSQEEVKHNADTYIEQAMKILDPEKTKIVHNADWILPMNMEKLLQILSMFTVARILERDDFHNRYSTGQSIALHEFMYPVMQAYDSVMVKADVELGGTDQLFNLLAGRELMEKMGMEPQVCITLPLLEGTDGVKKMSKSTGNYIGVSEDPNDIFGKTMSIPDEIMVKYFRLASTLPVEEIDAIEVGLADGSLHPNKVKRQLAANITAAYCGEEAAREAEKHFDVVCKEKKEPEDIPVFGGKLTTNDEGKVYLAALMVETGLSDSAGNARRLIDGGGVKIDGVAIEKKQYNVAPEDLCGHTLKVGKLKFLRIPEDAAE